MTALWVLGVRAGLAALALLLAAGMALPAAAAGAPSDAVADRLLVFGERSYPGLFPGPVPSQQAGPFRYRHYPGTGAYLGVVTRPEGGYAAGAVYVMGGPFGPVAQVVGTLGQFVSAEEPVGFVARAGRGFTLEGRPFRVAGANAAQVIANVDRSGMRSALSLARQMGANVVRFFGASEIGSLDRSVRTLGSDPAFRPWFQAWDPVTRRAVPNTGDNGLRHLDAVIAAAREEGLRVIIALVDNWDFFYGGVNQYVLWHGAHGHGAFFTDPAIRQSYRDWVETLLTRVNTVTGLRYADEPTIMAWELINEPSCYGGEGVVMGSCDRRDIEAWITEMAAHVKRLAPRQLVAVGDQGRFGSRDSAAMGWPYRSTNEPDFETVLRMPDIDFGTYHLYALDLAEGDGSLAPLDWGLRYIRDREQVARSLGKPALLEEVGARNFGVHATMWSTWLAALDAEGGSGFVFWGIGARFANGQTVWDSQGYTIYPDSAGADELQHWIGRFQAGN